MVIFTTPEKYGMPGAGCSMPYLSVTERTTESKLYP
jgi:hypothetical protein